jgi:hypothetical protein
VCLAKAFPELPTSHLQDMQKQSGTSKPKPPKEPPTVHGPSCRQVVLWATPFQADTDSNKLLERVRLQLALHHSKLVVYSVSAEPSNGFVLATDVLASASGNHGGHCHRTSLEGRG